MRFADIIIDLAAVLSASRSVATKHVALRARQLDHFNKTSSIAAALRQAQSRHVPKQESREAGPARQKQDAGSNSEVHPDNLQPARSDPLAPTKRESNTTSRNDANGETELPSFAIRSKAVPADRALRDLRQREYLQVVDPTKRRAGAPGSAGPRPHPLDPRFQSRKPGLDALEAGAEKRKDVILEGIDLNVFRTSEASKTTGTTHEPPSEHLQDPPKRDPAEDLASPTEDSTVTSLAQGVGEHDPHNAQERHQSPGRKPSDEPTESETTPIVGNLEINSSSTIAQSPATVAQESEDVNPTPNLPSSNEPLGPGAPVGDASPPAYQLRESKVPSSRLSRLWNYGGLAAGMLGGALSESLSRGFGSGGSGSVMLSHGNMERLVAKLSRMRGAALKLGQMMSFQDSKMLPGPMQEVLQRVQDRADYMPSWQRDRVLAKNLGSDWRDLYDMFEEKPIAAASIGQVHRATLKSNGAPVAVKIQFPGVADSINSDLDNIAVLLAATRLLPKGLYLDKTIANARTELAWECDYEREARCGQRYRELLTDEQDVFRVPKIYPAASGKQVLTMEHMDGVGVTRVKSFSQEQRDWIGTQILRLCLREITEFKFMQTDPNWTNFLYNAQSNKLELLDFGASREYPDRFISLYVRLLRAASQVDKAAVRDLSQELGYLTGHESKAMLDAHTQSVMTLAEPFLSSAPDVYDFQDQTITERVKDLIPVMVRERLAPPPEETYSLHRKLSGAFLLCARLGSRVRCREMFENSLQKSDLLSNM